MEGGVKKSVTTPRQTTLKCSTFSNYSKANECTLRDRHYACTEADGFALKRLR